VTLHRSHAYLEAPGDLLVAKAGGQEAGHFGLAGGKSRARQDAFIDSITPGCGGLGSQVFLEEPGQVNGVEESIEEGEGSQEWREAGPELLDQDLREQVYDDDEGEEDQAGHREGPQYALPGPFRAGLPVSPRLCHSRQASPNGIGDGD
jgi:hypothetical protein